MQSTWPRVGDGALSAPLFADKQVGLGALSSDPWIQQLSVDRTLFSLCHGGLRSPTLQPECVCV